MNYKSFNELNENTNNLKVMQIPRTLRVQISYGNDIKKTNSKGLKLINALLTLTTTNKALKVEEIKIIMVVDSSGSTNVMQKYKDKYKLNENHGIRTYHKKYELEDDIRINDTKVEKCKIVLYNDDKKHETSIKNLNLGNIRKKDTIFSDKLNDSINTLMENKKKINYSIHAFTISNIIDKQIEIAVNTKEKTVWNIWKAEVNKKSEVNNNVSSNKILKFNNNSIGKYRDKMRQYYNVHQIPVEELVLINYFNAMHGLNIKNLSNNNRNNYLYLNQLSYKIRVIKPLPSKKNEELPQKVIVGKLKNLRKLKNTGNVSYISAYHNENLMGLLKQYTPNGIKPKVIPMNQLKAGWIFNNQKNRE